MKVKGISTSPSLALHVSIPKQGVVSSWLLAGECLVVPHLEKGFPFHPTTEAQGHKSQRGSFNQSFLLYVLCVIFDSVPSLQNLHQFLHIELFVPGHLLLCGHYIMRYLSLFIRIQYS